jgi:ech hydrogenase subunit D
VIERDVFLARVGEYHKQGRRLALINVTTIVPVAAPAHGARPDADPAVSPEPAAQADTFEIVWAFEDDGDASLETIREIVTCEDAIPSVSEFFGAAFIYENEMRELFGLKVEGINLDLRGQLYKTATKIPFSHAAVKARLDAVNAAAAKAAAAGASGAAVSEPKA